MSYSQSQPRQPASQFGGPGRSLGSPLSGIKLRLMIGAAIVIFSLISFMGTSQINPVTGAEERVALTVKDEIALGRQHAARMGQPSRDYQAQMQVNQIGASLVQGLEREYLQGKQNPYEFEFTLLADPNKINAFALPGGQVFITEGLFRRLTNESQVAGVLAHEMGHVIERHSAKQMAKSGLISGVTGAAGMLGGDASSSKAAASLGNLFTLRYSREAEFQADAWSVKIAKASRYDPSQMISVLEILKRLGGGQAPPEFLSTHPSSDSRIESIRQLIAQQSNALESGNRPLRVLQQFD